MELGKLPDIYLCLIVFSFTGIFLNTLNIVVLCVSSRKILPMCRLVINLAADDIQSNFNGSNTFETMKISSRQG